MFSHRGQGKNYLSAVENNQEVAKNSDLSLHICLFCLINFRFHI